MEKAKIIIKEGERKDKNITVHFNPSDYQLSLSSEFEVSYSPGDLATSQQFKKPGVETLTVKLLFDTYMGLPKLANIKSPKDLLSNKAKEDVSNSVNELVDLARVDKTLKRPPRIIFSWASLEFAGIITNTKTQYTMFMSSGRPVRATVDLTITDFEGLTYTKRQEDAKKSAQKRKEEEKSKKKDIKKLDAKGALKLLKSLKG